MSMKLTISVSDIETVLASFNVIRVKRSVDGEEGDYELLTSTSPSPAKLTANLAENYDVDGKTLELAVDSEDPVLIVFTGAAPLDADAVALQINDALGASVASDSVGFLKLTSTTSGTGSKIEVVSGSSLGEFGFSAGDTDYGEDAHIPLQTGINLYDYIDKSGVGDYYYKAQFYNTSTHLASVDSEPFRGVPGTVVGAENLSLAQVDLVDGSGIAVAEQAITFWSVYEVIEADAFIVGIQRKPIATIVTDASGHAEVKLVRGLKIKVVFEGTSIIREFTVPDEDSFDLLDQLSSSPDPFDLREPDFHLALRRTL